MAWCGFFDIKDLSNRGFPEPEKILVGQEQLLFIGL